MNKETRNLVDRFHGMEVDDIKLELDKKRNSLEIAIENLERDFNMGTIVRSANAFNVSAIHIVGRRQWNKRGAMATDKYMNIYYYATVEHFRNSVTSHTIIGIDNVRGSKPLSKVSLPRNAILVFGSEGSGLSQDMLSICTQVVEIEQSGSTRSINVGVAAGIAMYAWIQQHSLK